MKRIFVFFLICLLTGVCNAKTHNNKHPTEITLSAVDALKMAGAMIDRGD